MVVEHLKKVIRAAPMIGVNVVNTFIGRDPKQSFAANLEQAKQVWPAILKEAEAANSLADQGIDVITVHVDGPKVAMETAERRGIYCCGYHANQQKLAPKGYLTGAEWNWASVYRSFVEKAQKGEPLPNFVRGGLADGFVKMSPYGPAVPEATRKQADAAKAQILKGGYSVFKGPLKDNRGQQQYAGAALATQPQSMAANQQQPQNGLAGGVGLGMDGFGGGVVAPGIGGTGTTGTGTGTSGDLQAVVAQLYGTAQSQLTSNPSTSASATSQSGRGANQNNFSNSGVVGYVTIQSSAPLNASANGLRATRAVNNGVPVVGMYPV